MIDKSLQDYLFGIYIKLSTIPSLEVMMLLISQNQAYIKEFIVLVIMDKLLFHF